MIKDLIDHAREFKLAGMLFHQFLKASERHNLAQSDMRGLRPGLGAENFRSIIN